MVEKMNDPTINASINNVPLHYKVLNEKIHQIIKSNPKKIVLNDVCGQRFIATALEGDIQIEINGLPGNDLGIFMDGPKITVYGNCEDQAGNTMNDGQIVIHGDGGDVIGLSARGGKIYVKKDVGYRVGIHIKEYEHKFPVIFFGGTAKDFLGEYMAGGLIVGLGLKFENGNVIESDRPICGNDLGTGIHRGKIILRTDENLEDRLGIGAKLFEITEQEKVEIEPFIKEFCETFNIPQDIIDNKSFQVIKPISKRPFGGNYNPSIV